MSDIQEKKEIKEKKPSLLLHICCIGCGAYISQSLKEDYQVSLFYYNPNIFPVDEYAKRLSEAKKIATQHELEIIEEKYDHEAWLQMVKGLEQEPERGKRCLLCYEDRLRQTAQQAKENGFDIFGTTLTISPHKEAVAINNLGKKLAKEYDIEYLDKDFKKQDGFKKSCELSKQLGLYRQDYCGCEFSRRG